MFLLLPPRPLSATLVFPFLFLVLWPPLPVAPAPAPAALDRVETCNLFPLPSDVRIPPPFGISGDQPPGFRVTCKDGGNGSVPMLSIGNAKDMIITNISLEEGYVQVLMAPFYFRPLRPGSGVVAANGLSLEGTPFAFSGTRNKFTVVGCDNMATVNGSAGENYTSGCVSFCITPNNAIDGACSGVGCCQASLRPEGLKRIDLSVTSIRDSTMGRSNTTSFSCAEAFLVDQEEFTFSHKLLQCTGKTSRKVALNWAIGNETCDQARGTAGYACKAKSECYNSRSGVGYLCNCSEGYSGNPYVGCSDIDECHPANGPHPCVGRCDNVEGSFNCPCPPGYRGDGRHDGTGCERPTKFEIAIGAGLGLVILLLAGGIVTYWEMTRRRSARVKQRHFMRNGGFLLQNSISSMDAASTRIFSIDELTRATRGFSSNNVVGQGGYGTVYRGVLSDGTVVAIKKSKVMDESQVEQFVNEVVILSKVRHPNVVRLHGCCLESAVPLLVYEFVPNGALFDHVHNASAIAHMPWEYRLRVLVETAQALAHLHTTASIPVIHRDVKSCNILLDKEYRAKVSDFGASRLVPYDQTHVTTVVQGTLGYLDPEYFHTSQLTEKSDVYSFGVVVVELLSSEKPVSFCRAERNLASHFLVLLEERRLMEVVDYRIAKEAGAMHVFEVAQLAKSCLRLRGEERPTMSQVAVVLNALWKLMMLHHSENSVEKNKMMMMEFPLGRPLGAGRSHSRRGDDDDDEEQQQQHTAESHLLS